MAGCSLLLVGHVCRWDCIKHDKNGNVYLCERVKSTPTVVTTIALDLFLIIASITVGSFVLKGKVHLPKEVGILMVSIGAISASTPVVVNIGRGILVCIDNKLKELRKKDSQSD